MNRSQENVFNFYRSFAMAIPKRDELKSSFYHTQYMDISLGLHFTINFMYFAIMVTNLIGNSLVIYVVGRNKSMHKVTNFFIMNLSFADILTNIFSSWHQFEIFTVNDSSWMSLICKIKHFFRASNVTASILSLVIKYN